MPAYFLFDNVEVTDPDGLARYAEAAARTVADHGGRYLAVASEPEVVEGDSILTAPVLIEFPDLGAARAWYDSPEYQEAKAVRQSASTASFILVEGA